MGQVILATAVGAASGARAAAAALACAGSEPDRPGLLVELGGRAPRPTLIASSGARGLEQRLAVHLPQLPPAYSRTGLPPHGPRRPRGLRQHPRRAAPRARLGRGSARAAVARPGTARRAGPRTQRRPAPGRPRLRPRAHRPRRPRPARPWPRRASPEAPSRLDSGPPRPLRSAAARGHRPTCGAGTQGPPAAPNSGGARVLRCRLRWRRNSPNGNYATTAARSCAPWTMGRTSW